MKITMYIGLVKCNSFYGAQSQKWEVECLSLNKDVVNKRLSKLQDDYYTRVKQRTFNTEKLDEIKYLFK